MKTMPRNKDEVAEAILIIAACPILLVTGAKCMILNAYSFGAFHTPNIVYEVQQSWLAWVQLYWMAFLGGCALLLSAMRDQCGYLAIAALIISALFWAFTPVIACVR